MINRSPKVSVILPSNRPLSDLTKVSYKSIIQQKYRNIEVLIFLNGISKKECDLILEFLFQNNIHNHTINHFYNKDPILPGNVRSELLNFSSGEYIIFLDADDIPDINLISIKIECAKKFKVDMVCSNAYTFSKVSDYKSGEMYKRNYSISILTLKYFRNSLIPLAINLVPNSGTLIRKTKYNKKILANYPKSRHEDFLFYLELISHVNGIALIQIPLISYHINRNTLTGNKIISKIWHVKALFKVKRIPFIKSIILTLSGVLLLSPIFFILNKIISIFNMIRDRKNDILHVVFKK